jgi:predicted GTPase
LHIVVADARRAGHEVRYHPGEANLRMADVVIINKIDSSKPEDVKIVENNISETNPEAKIIHANLKIIPEKPELIKDKRVLVIEDGPTLTHGELATGAAFIAAKEHGAKEIVDPRKNAVGSIKDIYEKYTHLQLVLPAMGYSKQQIKELEETINATDCDLVLIGTPINLKRLLKINKPAIRVRYEIEEIGRPTLEDVLDKFQI